MTEGENRHAGSLACGKDRKTETKTEGKKDMQHFSLIGRQLSHSYSKMLFEERFGSGGLRYDLIELESLDGLRDEVERRGLDGFNVTIPYKVDILPLLDDIDDAAREIGAVNTVKVQRTAGRLFLKGFNTDSAAFAQTISQFEEQNKSFDITGALILGTGGAARAVAYALSSLGIGHSLVSRAPHGDRQIDYETAYSLASERTLIVNATPVGMFPNCSQSPWQCPDLLGPRHFCYDLIYNPSPTRFLQEAALRGATTSDGLAILHLQAHKAWKIWGLE